LLSRLPLYGWTLYLGIKDNYAYINSKGSDYDPFTNCLYKIDITDKENPEIINEIFSYFEKAKDPIRFYGNYLAYHSYDYTLYLKFYSISNMELVSELPTNNQFLQINDSVTAKMIPYTNNQFKLYDFSDPTNVTELGEIDLSECNFEEIENFKMISENVFASLSWDGIAFWDINDISDWEFISSITTESSNCNFALVDDYLIVSEQHGLESINIADLTSPYSVDFYETDILLAGYIGVKGIYNYNNNVYLGTGGNGIEHFAVNNGIIYKVSDNYQYPIWAGSYSYIYTDYLFLPTMTKGVWIFDISNPVQPEHVQTILDSHYIYIIQFKDNLVAIWDGGEDYYSSDDNEIKIYDISNPENLTLRNTIQNVDYTIQKFDDTNSNHIYLIKYYPDYQLKKYDISQEGEAILEFEFALPEKAYGVFHNGYAYLLGISQSDNQTLYIIGGLQDNDPAIISTINNFADGYPNAGLYKCEEYFYIKTYHPTSPGDKYYELQSPTELVHLFILNAKSVGLSTINTDDLLFVPLIYTTVYIYDVSGNPIGQLEPISTFYDYSFSTKCLFYENNDTKYLFHCQGEAVSVYEYSYTGVDEQHQLISNFILSNYPNPFSASTTISFNINHKDTKNTKGTKMKIYNIKGQIIKTFRIPNPESRTPNIVWDGKDEYGKQLPSGIYFCKLSSGDKSAVKKMLILR
ncbi:MAG: T9SS type A sorting domain-containing protein, partial [Candidatus Cloacimonetes bacterium]|nr:T9SS type A sorting domain-containing protein [Candidatus Cloacimonadota bacterium]